ncbi:hypothetical protein [Paraglaciecola sp. MB-3u-78]|nr:hypothetical protein [Paraglaciecola sp. MB-3u-78]
MHRSEESEQQQCCLLIRPPYRGGTTGDRCSHAIFEPLNFIAPTK